MSDYTPTTEEVYRRFWRGTPLRSEDKLREYVALDRWLAEVKAQAVIELVARIEAAVILLGDDDITPTGRRMISKVLNPYRGGEGSGNDASQSLVESGNLLNGEEQ